MGERFMPGIDGGVLEKEHLARYCFACSFVAGLRVADIACGAGYGSQILAEAGAVSVFGADVSESAVAHCKDRYRNARVTYVVADAQHLSGIADHAFDMVVSFETIEHLPDVTAYLGEIARILKPGGKYLVSTPDRRVSSVMHPFTRRPSNKYHVREWVGREFLDLLSTRFQIDSCYGQEFLSWWLVWWPIQVFIKAGCRILRSSWAREFVEVVYSNRGNVEVMPPRSRWRIPKYWVISCIRPDSSHD